jgi:hypothetical protein
MGFIQDGTARVQAFANIESLKCPSHDPSLADCDSSAQPPADAVAWRKTLEDASVSTATYPEALARELKTLICSGARDTIYVLRGLLRSDPNSNSRFADTGSEAPTLVDSVLSKDCPASASLTADDNASLLQVMQAAIENARQEPAH